MHDTVQYRQSTLFWYSTVPNSAMKYTWHARDHFRARRQACLNKTVLYWTVQPYCLLYWTTWQQNNPSQSFVSQRDEFNTVVDTQVQRPGWWKSFSDNSGRPVLLYTPVLYCMNNNYFYNVRLPVLDTQHYFTYQRTLGPISEQGDTHKTALPPWEKYIFIAVSFCLLLPIRIPLLWPKNNFRLKSYVSRMSSRQWSSTQNNCRSLASPIAITDATWGSGKATLQIPEYLLHHS